MSQLRVATFNLLHGQPMDHAGRPLPTGDPGGTTAPRGAVADRPGLGSPGLGSPGLGSPGLEGFGPQDSGPLRRGGQVGRRDPHGLADLNAGTGAAGGLIDGCLDAGPGGDVRAVVAGSGSGAGAGRGSGPDAASPLAEAIAALDADVLALQEVDRFQERSGRVDQAAVGAKALGALDYRFAAAVVGHPAPVAGWVHAPNATALRVYGPDDAGRDADQPAYGTALLTRLPVLHWRARRFPAAPFGLPLRVAGRRGLTPVPDEPRAALAAVLDGPAGPFTVVAAHLSFVPGWNMGQLAGMRRWIADLPMPYLLLGDFNLIGPVPRTVLGGASVMDGGRLPLRPRARRPLRAASPRGSLQGWRDLARTPTYPAHRPTVQFDHVLAVGVPRTAVQRVETPTTGVSDHRPLLVELSLPETATRH